MNVYFSCFGEIFPVQANLLVLNPRILVTPYLEGEFFQVNDTHGTELLKTIGTTAGTVLVKDIYPTGGSNPDADTPTCFGVAANQAVFDAYDGTQYELYASDGSEAGTFFVENMNGGSFFSP